MWRDESSLTPTWREWTISCPYRNTQYYHVCTTLSSIQPHHLTVLPLPLVARQHEPATQPHGHCAQRRLVAPMPFPLRLRNLKNQGDSANICSRLLVKS